MNNPETKLDIYKSAKDFSFAICIDYFSPKVRSLLKNVSLIFIFVYLFVDSFKYNFWATMFFLLSIIIFILTICLNLFRTYYYLRGTKRVFEKNDNGITYEIAKVYRKGNVNVSSLVLEEGSSFLLNRLQLNKEHLVAKFGFISLPKEINKEENHPLTIGVLWKYIYDSNEEFAHYLLSNSVKKETFYRTTSWLDRNIEHKKISCAWWWRENLSRIGGPLKSLSYGFTGYISKYALDMDLDRKMSELGDVVLHKKELNDLEEILAKGYGSNALIVGKHGSGRYTITLELARLIKEGFVYSELKDKRMFLLKPSSFELINDKVEFENSILSVFNEAVTARNIIFVIDDISKFVEMSKNLSVDFFSLIDPYIDHSSISLVILTDENISSKEEYKKVFEKRFETIMMRDLNVDLLLPYIEDKVSSIEKRTGRLFTYPSLEVIAESLEQFFVEEAPLIKANDFIESLATSSFISNVITKEDVYTYLKNTTGVSLGKINEEEKDNLLKLEEVLKKRVIGQEEATLSVAKTMRRVRSLTNDRKKPMGTFLFFGPTGTGKTETAKTLASVFFGKEEYMSRIDMGEYSLPESLNRLIGSNDSEGELAKLIHMRSYGVLLLDEFEKASNEVKDMFLRILDEGVFTNGQGNIVSLRTQIIVATSNAGTEFLMEYSESDEYKIKTFDEVKQKVIDFVLEKGILKPELINRFDESVMFLPLGDIAIKGVISKMLEGLAHRMKEKSFTILWNDDVIDYIKENSEVKKWGGRSIKRFIQDNVEDFISKKIIDGSLKEGGSVTLSKEDLEFK